MPLTGKNVLWKIKHNKNILRLRTFKKNTEPHQKFTGFYQKGVEALEELQNRRISKIKR